MTLRMPITKVRVPQANVRGPMASGAGALRHPRPCPGGQGERGRRRATALPRVRRDDAPLGRQDPVREGTMRRGSERSEAEGSASAMGAILRRVAQLRVVHEQRPRRPDEVERPGHHHRPIGGSDRGGDGSAGIVARPSPGRNDRPPRAAQRAARAAAGRARGPSTAVATTRAPASDRAAASAPSTPSTSLSPIIARTSVGAAGRRPSPFRRSGRSSSRAAARAAAPAGLWAPSRSTSASAPPGPAPGTASSSRRPGQRAAAYPARRAAGGTPCDPGLLDRVEHRVRDGHVRRLVPAQQADPRRAQPGKLHERPPRSIASTGAGAASIEVDADPAGARPEHGQRGPGRTGHRAVTATDDRGLLAGDRGNRRAQPLGVVEIDVRDRGDAAVPRVRRVEAAAEADLDDGEVDRLAGEPGEGERRDQLELGRRAVAPGHGVGDREDCADDRP